MPVTSLISEMFPTHELISYAQTAQLKNFALEELFPSFKAQTDDIRTITNVGQVPQIAHIHAYNTEAEIGSRSGEVTSQEPYFMKRKMVLNEKDLRELAKPRDAVESEYIKGTIYADATNLINSINASVELMRVKALTEGQFTLKGADGQDYAFDYQLPDSAFVTKKTSVDFSDPTVNPIEVIQNWQDNANFEMTRGVMSPAVQRAILSNPQTVAMIYGQTSIVKAVLPGDFKQFMATQELPEIVVYRGKYTDNNQVQNFMAGSKLSLFGDGQVGQTAFGITPEEARQVRAGEVQSGQVGNIMIESYEESHDPIESVIKASAVAIPTISQRHSLVIADVLKTK